MENKLYDLVAKIAELVEGMNKGLEEMDERLKRVENTVNRIEATFDNEIKYSPDETLERALLMLKAGRCKELVKQELNLSDHDLELLDFIISEY